MSKKVRITPNFKVNFPKKLGRNIQKYDIFKIKSKYELFKQHSYVIIYGTHTFLGRLFDILLLASIVISVFLVMLESVESINQKYSTILVVLEWIITIFFSIEYILRIVSHDKPLRYVFSFYGMIDLISILPMYLSFFVPNMKLLSTIRIFRLLRVFRILSLVQFTDESNKLIDALVASRRKIMIFIYFVLVICIFLGTLMFLVESPHSGFTSIPRSIYWCVVTLTTVGYGDIAPLSPLGQMIATAIMMLGYGIIAVPTGIVTSEYTNIQHKGNKNQKETENEINKNSVKKVCSTCLHQEFLESSVYCHRCGSLLQNTEI